ncbi:MAG: 2-oxo acid dehydrogenase subunit E2, partial [Bacteroidales bacterium]|nr:2-oxo acid dehydrogenase subunit E2 [Bacteroidales bacterium]
MIELKVPSPGESITQVQLASWLVAEGDQVEKDQEVAEIDSDKATLTINAEESGKISLQASEGDTLEVGAIIAIIDTTTRGTPGKEKKPEKKVGESDVKSPEKEQSGQHELEKSEAGKASSLHISPLAKKILGENKITEEQFIDFLKGYHFKKKDVEFYLNEGKTFAGEFSITDKTGSRETEKKKMSTLRLKVSERLVSVKNQTAMLTTFNEVNMTPIFDIRKKFKEKFKEKFGVSLGFMSFFTKAVTIALKHFPEINAQLDGDGILYHNYADIGIAVSSPKGLMVPVLRNAEAMNMAEIELKIKELATKAR